MSIVPAAMPSRRRHSAYNPGPEEIPAHAAVEWSVVNADGAFILRKPDKDDSPTAFFNTETAIPVGGYGYVTKHLPTWALYHAADGTPSNGESLGTRAGFWEIYRGYEGFLVWGGADGEKVYVQSDLTCRETGGADYYYYSRRRNPKFGSTCCSGKALSSVLQANVIGTTAHDTGVNLYRWNGGYYNPVPWLPLFLGQSTLMGRPYTYPGWTSHVIEDFSQDYDFTITFPPSGGDTVSNRWQFTDRYYYVVGFDYLVQACGLWLEQWRERTGTQTITHTNGSPTVVSSMNTPTNGTTSSEMRQALLTPNRFGACDTLTCTPFYRKQTVGRDGSAVFAGASPPYCAAPTWDTAALLAGSLFASAEVSTCDEPDGTCVSSTPGGPQIEVWEPSEDPEPWDPPPPRELGPGDWFGHWNGGGSGGGSSRNWFGRWNG